MIMLNIESNTKENSFNLATNHSQDGLYTLLFLEGNDRVLIDKEDDDFVGWMPASDLVVYSFDS